MRLGPARWASLAGLLILLAGAANEYLDLRAERQVERYRGFFEEPDLRRPALFLPADTPLPPLAAGEMPERRGIRPYAAGYTPLVCWTMVRPVRMQDDGRNLWTAPDLLFAKRSKTARLDKDSVFRYFMLFLSAACAAGCAYLFVRWRSFASLLAAAALARIASLAWLFSLAGFFTTHANDETNYWMIACKLLGWEGAHGPYYFTLGLPILYLPLAAFVPGLDPLVVAGWLSGAFFLLFGIGSLWCWLWLLRELGLENRRLRFAACCLAFYPWICAFFEDAGRHFTMLGHWIGVPIDFQLISSYYAAQWLGYTALSDTPAHLFGVLGLALLARALRKEGNLFLPGFAIGFSTLIRLPGIYYLLPAAYLLLLHPRRREWRNWGALGIGALVFAPFQLAWNAWILGSPWTLGYAAYPQDYAGFEWKYLAAGVDCFGSMHYQLFVLGAVAFVVVARERVKETAFLALCVLPTLIFYAGFASGPGNPVRYLFFPLHALLAAAGIQFAALAERPDRRLLGGVILLWLLAFTVLPEFPAVAPGYFAPAWLAPVVFGFLALAGIAYFRSAGYAVAGICLAVGTEWAAVGLLVTIGAALAARGLWRLRRETISQVEKPL